MNKLREELTGVGGVTGLGYSGDLAVDDDNGYRGTNAMSYVDENGNHLEQLRVSHINHHNKHLGFRAFDPTRIGAMKNFHHHDKKHLHEKITEKTSTSDVIHDFVHSKNKKFKGDSKKQRIKRALGAYYSMHKEEKLDELFDTPKGKERGKEYVRKSGLQMYQLGRDDQDDIKRRNNLESNPKMDDKGKDGDKVRKMHGDTMKRLTRNWRMMKNRTKYVPKALDKLTKEEALNEISNKLAQRYYDKAMSTDFSKEHGIVNNPKGKPTAFNRLIGVNRAVARGAKPEWKTPDFESPKKINSLAHIMRKKVRPYGEDPKPTEKKTGRGVGRLYKLKDKFKAQIDALDYPIRLTTPQIREPDMFWQGPEYPPDREAVKTIAKRDRAQGKLDKVVAKINQYGDRPDTPKKKNIISPNEQKQFRITKNYNVPGKKILAKEEMLDEAISKSKRKITFNAHKRKRKAKKEMNDFDPRRMLAAHNRKAAHNDANKNRVNEETTMDIRETISEAIINMLDKNYVNMKENFEAVLNAKAVERLDEMKREIASTYFASDEE